MKNIETDKSDNPVEVRDGKDESSGEIFFI